MKRKKPVTRYACRDRMQTLLLLLLLAPLGFAFAAEPYYLDELALGVKDAPGPVRADLAYAAISELAAAFALESSLARQEMRRQPGQRKLRRWAVAVESLASGLDELAQTVTTESSVHIGVGPANSLYLIVDDNPVVISGPRMSDQSDLEKRIVSRFCQLHPCKQLMPAPLLSDAKPVVITRSSQTHWSFSTDTGPLCSTDDGLEFQFKNVSDLRRKREACARVVAELHTLAAEITRRRKQGARVQWKAMRIVTLPLGGPNEVQLNSDGDTLSLYVPALAAAPELFLLLRPWLIATVSGARHRVTIGDAETLLPPVGFMGQ